MSTQVTINDVPPKTQITATAGQTVFTTNWTANAASDVVVYARTSAQEPDDLTQEVSSANYTVAFIGVSETVEVTFLVGKSAGDVITITRDTPADRLNLYTNTNFTPSMLNQDVGILTLVDQQAQLYNTQVAPHYNVSATPDLGDPISGLGGDIYLPILGANESWKKNSSNTAIEAITFPTGGGLAPSDATYIVQTPWSPSGELPNQQALSPLATGFMSSVTGTGVVSTRTLQGTANQINVTNGTGTGNPVFSLSSALLLPGTMTFGGNVDANGFNISNVGQANIGNIQISGNTIESTDTNGNVIITPDGTGDLVLDGLNWPQADGTNGQAVTTNGAGQLGWTSFGSPYTPAALTSTSDTNVTITLGGTPTTALLQATSITMGWSGQLSIARGGTNNSVLGANGTLAQSDGTKYSWTTATYPSTATTIGTILRANGTNWAATTATYPNTTSINHILYSSAANVIGEIADAIGGVLVSNNTGVPSMLANPSDNYRVLQSKNAAIPEWSVAAYPHTAGANGTLMQSDGTDWTNTQATYPGSTNKNHILYSSANNTVGEIATQKNAVLVSDNQSTPQWSGSLSDGQIIIGKTNDLPAAASITGSGSITVTPGANSITISSSASGTVNAGTANQLAYYATTGSAVSGLTTANNGVLITSAVGVPSISSTLPSAVQANISNVGLSTGTISTTPTSATDITNKAYVDTVAQGLSVKAPARWGTTGNITLSGLGTQAGGEWTSSLTAGDRILVKNQGTAADNGIYSASSVGWTRTADANSWDELVSAFIFVQQGATLADTSWVCTVDPGGTLGVTPVTWVQFSGAGTYTAGTGLTLAGNQFSITNTGVTANSYGGASSVPTFTVNAQGQLTTASTVAVVAPAGTLSGTTLAANVVSSSLTSVGTINSGTWNGGIIGTAYGGTGNSTVGANGTLAQSDGSKYTFTTATYPSTTTVNRLIYSSATNTVTDLPTANSATLVTNSTGVPSWTNSMTNGQVLIGSTGATPVPATITGTAGITVTNGAGTITISGGGGGYTWTEVTGTTQSITANNGYIANNPALVTLTLPTTAALGTTISIAGKGAGGWRIAQNAGQQIFFGSSSTTSGATGYLQSTQQYDSIELLCITADTQWTVLGGPQGNITVA